MKALTRKVYFYAENLIRTRWYALVLSGIVLLSFWLNFYAISQIGYGNAYYAAAIKSMLQSWHNFFFVSFDPAGMVSVDKPPIGLWVQCLFVLVFGYHGWAMLLPQALAGAASCGMLYGLTAKHFGRWAGLLAALVFALTPAAVVASRNNTMDMQLVLVLLIAVWFLFRSLETAKRRYLFLAGAMIGVGFNIKMLQAFLILPSVVLIYLLCAKEKPGRRFLSGIVATAVMLAVSFAWVAAVDLTPTSQRPYVGSSTNNTELELIIGHNGMERIGSLWGVSSQRSSGFGGNSGGKRSQTGWDGNSNQHFSGGNGAGSASTGGPNRGGQAPNGQNGQNGGPSGSSGVMRAGNRTMGGTGNDIGTAGFFRLWQTSMFGQASWLLLPAVFCVLACIRKFSIRKMTLRQGIFLFWASWLFLMAAFFSFASFFHRYYLCMLAPGIAGVVGIGFPEMYRLFRRRNGWRQWLLPACLITSDAVSASYVWSYAELRPWLFPIIVGFGILALALMSLWLLHPGKKGALKFSAACVLISMLAGPFYWSLTATLYVSENITMPYAGPELKSTATTTGMTANQQAFVSSDSGTAALEKYLVQNYKEGSFLLVAQSSNEVAQIIADTGLPAVAYGGFLGTDNSLTLEQFKSLVEKGKVTYFLVADSGGTGNDSGIVSYVKTNAKKIDASKYGGAKKIGQISFTLYCFHS